MSDVCKFEPHQEEALKKVREILEEHFDGSLLVISVTSGLADCPNGDLTQVVYTGGITHAVGAAKLAGISLEKTTTYHPLTEGQL